MLQNDIVAEFLTQEFNKVAEKYGRKIAIHDGAYDHDNFRAYINGIITLQSPEVLPILNYVNMNCRYSLDFNLSLLGGFSRLNNINDIIDEVMFNVNGKLVDIAGGQAIFMLRLPSTSDLQIREVIGQSVIPKVIVEVEYSVRTGGTKYQMALIDTVFDNGSVNTRWFASQTEQIEYYNNKVANGGAPYCDLMTPNLNSLTLNKQVYINDLRYYSQGTTKPLDASEILLKNYAIIRSLDETGQATSYYYYYITSATINSNNQISLDLQLDTVQTYYFNPSIEFSDCLINRAHLNRFIDNGDGTVSFDGTETSNLFKSEPFGDLPKRMVNRTKLNFNDTGIQEVDEWLNENIAFWVYVFLDSSAEYENGKNTSVYNVINPETGANTTITKSTTTLRNSFNNTGMAQDYGCYCYPIYKSNSNQLFVGTDKNSYIWLHTEGHRQFRELNNNSSYFYNVKLSLNSPFDFREIEENDYGKIENGNLYLNAGISLDNNSLVLDNLAIPCLATKRFDGLYNVGILTELVSSQLINNRKSNIVIEETFNFEKLEIVGKNKNINLEPKLLGQNYKELRLVDFSGNSYTYDKQKLNTNNLTFIYTEPLQSEISKYYIRLQGNTGLYSIDTDKNFLGVVGSNDMSIPIVNDKYSEFLANNKNFWLQSNTQIMMDGVKNLQSSISNAISGNLAGGVESLISGGLGLANSIIQRQFTVDNMKASPSALKNANGNCIFLGTINDISCFIEEWESLEKDTLDIYNYLFMNGYLFELIDKIKNYDHIRKYFNFVQAEVENIGGISISNNAREDLRQRFRNGVRFWNSDNIQYDLENYEIWLEN